MGYTQTITPLEREEAWMKGCLSVEKLLLSLEGEEDGLPYPGYAELSRATLEMAVDSIGHALRDPDNAGMFVPRHESEADDDISYLHGLECALDEIQGLLDRSKASFFIYHCS